MTTITNQAPPSGSAIKPLTRVRFDVADLPANFVIYGYFRDGTYDVIWDGSSFAPYYGGTSTRTDLGGGAWHYDLWRTGGWKFSPRIVVSDGNKGYAQTDWDPTVTIPLVVEGLQEISIPEESGDVYLPLALEGHTEGSETHILIEAGNASSVTEAPRANSRGDLFDPALNHEISYAVRGGYIHGERRTFEAPDMDPPTILSATVYQDAPTILVVRYSVPTWVPENDLQGFECTGVAVQPDIIDEGNGLDTHYYELTGPVTVGQSPVLVVAAGACASMNGPEIEADSVDVDNQTFPFTGAMVDFWDLTVPGFHTVVSSRVSAWTGLLNGNVLAQAVSGSQPDYNATDSTLGDTPTLDFDGTEGNYLLCAALEDDGNPLPDSTAYSVALLLKWPSSATQIHFEITPSAGTLFTGLIAWNEGTTTINQGMVAETWAVTAAHDPVAAGWKSLVFTYDSAGGGLQKCYLNGTLVAQHAGAANPAALVKAALGWSVAQLASYASDATMQAFAIWNQDISAHADRGVWDTMMMARFA